MPNLQWGAAMGVAIEWLTNSGYTKQVFLPSGVRYVVTEKWREYLKKLNDVRSQWVSVPSGNGGRAPNPLHNRFAVRLFSA
jgi:hypothetical protein